MEAIHCVEDRSKNVGRAGSGFPPNSTQGAEAELPLARQSRGSGAAHGSQKEFQNENCSAPLQMFTVAVRGICVPQVETKQRAHLGSYSGI